MNLDSLDDKTRIRIHGLLYRGSCRSFWMFAIVLLLTFLFISPLFDVLSTWISGFLAIGALLFSGFVCFWPTVPINQISKALDERKLDNSGKQEVNKLGDQLKDCLIPVVLLGFVVILLFLRTWKAV